MKNCVVRNLQEGCDEASNLLPVRHIETARLAKIENIGGFYVVCRQSSAFLLS